MNVKYIVIHASGMTRGGAAYLDKVHRKRGSFSFDPAAPALPYHFVIRQNGSIEYGRNRMIPGTAQPGYNDCSLGIALMKLKGDRYRPTGAQLDALKQVLKTLHQLYPDAMPILHSQLEPKKSGNCPGGIADATWREITGGH